MSETIAICVGHSRPVNGRPEGGAVSIGQITEWEYNSTLARLIAADLERYRIKSVIVDHYKGGGGYGTAMRWLAAHLEDLGVDAAIELHFNSGPAAARGHEWLHWHSSGTGKALADNLDTEMRLQLPPSILPARGLKPRGTGRGAEFLRLTHCPAVIAEPFFGSNHQDWNLATHYQGKIALGIANGIDAWLAGD